MCKGIETLPTMEDKAAEEFLRTVLTDANVPGVNATEKTKVDLKREQRLLRNRESAKKSRLRNQEQLASLRRKNLELNDSVDALNYENQTLRAMVYGHRFAPIPVKLPLPMKQPN